MRRVLVALICGVVGLAAVTPTHAAAPAATKPAVDWNQHDTAVYVVSTLNLLRTRNGHPMTGIFRHRMGARTYNVYQDVSVADLYFVELARSDQSVAGALAYKMGWSKPQSLTDSMGRLGVQRASSDIAQAYKSDHKTLIGSFKSTLPSS